MSSPSDGVESSEKVSGLFTTTHWSVVLSAGQSASPQAAQALETLCRTYWYPLYAYVRRQGYSPEDAQDLAQAFSPGCWRRTTSVRSDNRRASFVPSSWLRCATSFATSGTERAR